MEWEYRKERNEYIAKIGNLSAFITTGLGDSKRNVHNWRWMIKHPRTFTVVGRRYHKRVEKAKEEAENVLLCLEKVSSKGS